MFADAARAATTNTIRNMVLKTVWRTVYIFIYFSFFILLFFLAEPTFYLLLSVAIKVLTNSFDNNKNSKQKRIVKGGGTKNTAL